MGKFALLAFTLAAMGTAVQAQVPEPAGENLLRLEGTDAESGIHYLKFILLARSPEAPDAPNDSVPRFTMECREQHGKRSLHWLVRFDGSADFAFQRPVVATKENPHPVPNPTLNLKMRFEGYMKSQEFKRQWERLPTGELHYRNSGFSSANMDDPRYFLTWLTSLPNLRVGYLKPIPGQTSEVVFPTQPLLDAIKKADLCQP
jgi:hypothetical protein